ncbi:MAG: PilN domain-containing protein [Xanthomonadales bacterium]|nr:PilN domain-containing protein [Xanthomonadales bacterium]
MSTVPATRMRLQDAGRGMRGFLAWWARGLSAWLPAAWRGALAASSDRLLLQLADDDLLLLRHQGADGIRDIAALPVPPPRSNSADPFATLLSDAGRALPRWVLLPAEAGLRRTLVLPAAARERLRDVLGFEIERQTPFAAADVVYDGRLLRTREDGQLETELVVVPRSRFDAALGRLPGVADGLAGVELAAADGRPLGVNLLAPASRHRTRRVGWAWSLAFAGVGVLALVLALAQVLDNRRAASEALEREVAQRSAQARGVAQQRQRLVDAVEGGAYLQGLRNARPSVAEVMDELARRLPDGTYLEKLSVDGDQLTLVGLSNQAAALVGKLEGARQWRAPALSGALQQDPRTRSDRFTLDAKLSDAATPEERPRAAR